MNKTNITFKLFFIYKIKSKQKEKKANKSSEFNNSLKLINEVGCGDVKEDIDCGLANTTEIKGVQATLTNCPNSVGDSCSNPLDKTMALKLTQCKESSEAFK